MRKELRRSIREITGALLKKAEQGSVPELKLLLIMSGFHEMESGAGERKPKNFMQMLLDDWRKEPVNGSATEKYTIDGVPYLSEGEMEGEPGSQR